jgi:hypothetical protein
VGVTDGFGLADVPMPERKLMGGAALAADTVPVLEPLEEEPPCLNHWMSSPCSNPWKKSPPCARLRVHANVVSNWGILQSTIAEIKSAGDAVQANGIALKGVQEEERPGPLGFRRCSSAVVRSSQARHSIQIKGE